MSKAFGRGEVCTKAGGGGCVEMGGVAWARESVRCLYERAVNQVRRHGPPYIQDTSADAAMCKMGSVDVVGRGEEMGGECGGYLRELL